MGDKINPPVRIIFRDRQYTAESGITVRRLLRDLGISLQGVIVIRNDDLLTEDEVLREGDVITIVSAISGG